MHCRRFFAFAVAATILLVAGIPAHALTLKEFRKYTPDQQSVFISGAISMMAYGYASNSDVARARCIKLWYFGESVAVVTPGPSQVATELTIAERTDAEKFHVEGILLGVADKVCPANSPAKR